MGTIHQFFAVTRSKSLYRVTDEIDPETQIPLVEKLLLLGESRVIPGGRLKNGNLVGITNCILMFFTDKHNHTAWSVSANYLGGHSSPIIALFLEGTKARECLESEALEPWDTRWQTESAAVLRAIGREHPVFRPEESILKQFG
ncbi:MAG: hypothetical protein HW405_422 [Candidatus Berkelbacteria bacterium]|nr:hypothetical protein [Candidatus Berkelbacteria bacterium]